MQEGDKNCKAPGLVQVKPLKVRVPVNVIGTKQKGKVFKIGEDEVKLLITNQANEKLIRGHKYEYLQKVL